MNTDDRELAGLREALESLGERSQPTENCFQADKIWEAVHGEAQPDELRALVDHMSTCLVCAEAWEVAEDVRASEARTRRALPHSTSVASPRRLWWLSSVAAVLLFVIGAQWLPWQEWRFGSEFRGGDDATIRSLLAEDEPLPRQSCLLRWQGPDDSLRYDVSVTWVTTEQHRILFEAQNLTRTELLIPEDRLHDVPAGARLIWRVKALKDRRELAVSSFALRLE